MQPLACVTRPICRDFCKGPGSLALECSSVLCAHQGSLAVGHYHPYSHHTLPSGCQSAAEPQRRVDTETCFHPVNMWFTSNLLLAASWTATYSHLCVKTRQKKIVSMLTSLPPLQLPITTGGAQAPCSQLCESTSIQAKATTADHNCHQGGTAAGKTVYTSAVCWILQAVLQSCSNVLLKLSQP